MTATDSAREAALVAAAAAAEKLASAVTILDVSEQLVITAIVDEIEEKMRAHGVKPVRREGTREGRWVLLDFVDVVVHVQHEQERSFYGLERLWKDCPVIAFDAAAHTPADQPASSDAQTRDLTETQRLNELLKGQ